MTHSYVYCDNFRGFSDTLIPLRDINFLVGENSTGKTSILSLIGLLESFEFWYYNNFNKEHINLGYFSELTRNSEDITIGFTRFSNYGPDEEFEFIRTRFRNIDNVPTLHELSLLGRDYDLFCTCEDRKISYQVTPRARRQLQLDEFPNWVRSSRPSGPLEIIELKGGPQIFSPAMLPQFVFQEFRKKYPDKLSATNLPGFYGGAGVVWIAPIRAKPKRTYDSYTAEQSPEGDHIPYVINEILFGKANSDTSSAIRDFGKWSGLFDSITTKRYGAGKTAPFEIAVQMGRHRMKISNVGYGVSQVLPVIVESLVKDPRAWILVQQPEVHLHPRAQAALGNLFFALSTETKKRFIIETHSDYLIDRYRLLMSHRPQNAVDAQVVFCSRYKDANTAHVLAIDKNGKYPAEQPDAFREFFLKEQLSLLTI